MDYFVIYTIRGGEEFFLNTIDTAVCSVIWHNNIKKASKFESKGAAEYFAAKYDVRRFLVKQL